MRLSLLLFLLALLFLPFNVCAAGLKKAGTAELTPEQTWNPRADAGDLALPMPCNGQMILRAVAVPAKGYLYDKKIVMGVHNLSAEDRTMYERAYEAHLSAPFTPKDMPQAWRNTLKLSDSNNNLFYYFLGKYEVSKWQWDAVMGNQCPPAPAGAEMAQPVTEITWLQMQEFMHKYTAWLLENHKGALPRYAGNVKDIAFIRLPTEIEWEFAAKGGLAVPEEHRNQEDFHPLNNKQKADYAIFGSDKARQIGSRNPNPLSLYDMSGNVAEVVESLFRFTVPDMQGNAVIRRLHGSAGGLVAKGGSYRSTEEGILPGKREELAFFTDKGPLQRKDIGFRVAISGINTPDSKSRYNMLVEESKNIVPEKDKVVGIPSPPQLTQSDKAVKINPSAPLLAELEKIMQATGSSVVRGNLEQYYRMVADYNTAREKAYDEALGNKLRSMLYQISSQRNIGFRMFFLQDSLDRSASVTPPTPQTKEKFRSRMKEYKNMLGSATNNYKQELMGIVQFPQPDLERHFTLLNNEYHGNDVFSQEMQNNLAFLQNHIKLVRAKGAGSLTKEAIWQGILTDKQYELITTLK